MESLLTVFELATVFYGYGQSSSTVYIRDDEEKVHLIVKETQFSGKSDNFYLMKKKAETISAMSTALAI